MGTSQAPKLTPVEEQQLVGEVLFLRAKAEALAARLGPLEAANTAWAAANAELRKKAGDFSDGIYQMLVEAGASSDIDTMERQVAAAGTKPSHFVRKSFSELRGKLGEAWNELADLRAYKERTEAGLVALCRLPMRGWFKECLQAKSIGLWRDPPQAEVQP